MAENYIHKNKHEMDIIGTPLVVNGILELAGNDELPEWIQVLPLGSFEHPKHGMQVITTDILEFIKANFDKDMNYLVMDYEHSSIFGDTAPAAGWITELEIRTGGTGLWGKIQWTPNAIKQILAKEYRYVSPVYKLFRNELGVAMNAFLHSHALTNTPVIDGMTPLFNKRQDFESLVKGEDMQRNEDTYCKVDGVVICGDNLARALNRQIDSNVDDNTTRGDVVSRVARAGGIEPGTLNQILNGTINCPPLRRLEGFARELGVTVASLIRAAERDGCNYATASGYKLYLGVENDMLKDEIVNKFNLGKDVTDDDVLVAMSKVWADNADLGEKYKELEGVNVQLVNSQKAILKALGLPDAELNKGNNVDTQKASEYVANTLKEQYVCKEDFDHLKNELEAEKAASFAKERDEIILGAISCGKITPAQKESMASYACKDFDGFKAFIEALPDNGAMPMGETTKNRQPVKTGITNENIGHRMALVAAADKYFTEHPELDKKNSVVYRDTVAMIVAQNPELLELED